MDLASAMTEIENSADLSSLEQDKLIVFLEARQNLLCILSTGRVVSRLQLKQKEGDKGEQRRASSSAHFAENTRVAAIS